METIWKFELQTTDEQVISIPEKYQLLCVQTQFGKPQPILSAKSWPLTRSLQEINEMSDAE